MNRRPNMFVGIGAQKGGTTWVADYLQSHPNVFMSPIKELHFFDSHFMPGSYVDFNKNLQRKLVKMCNQLTPNNLNRKRVNYIEHLCRRVNMRTFKDYKKYFQDYSAGKKIVGEITPSYSLLQKEHFTKIAEKIPNCKFLFILRNPIDRYWSALRFTKKSIPDFNPLLSFKDKLNTPAYFDRTNYQKTIENLESAVPKSNILYLFYEDLFLSDLAVRKQSLKKLTDFLEIEFIEPNFQQYSNKSSSVPLSPKNRVIGIERFAEIYDFCHSYFKDDLPQSWISDMKLNKYTTS